MISTTDTLQQADLDKIAAPLVHKMQLLKPSLVDKLESYVPIKFSFTLTNIVFIGNLLHILVIYFYHKIIIFQRITLSFIKILRWKNPSQTSCFGFKQRVDQDAIPWPQNENFDDYRGRKKH